LNSKVHPLVALAVIVMSVMTIGVWMWGSGQAKQYGGPAELLTAPSGHIYIQMQNILLEHDAEGRFVERHDLSDLKVEQMLGTVRFFSNGDILLRRGADSRTTLDKIRAYLRLSNETTLNPERAQTGLYRCNLETDTCTPFGPETIDFAAAFGLYIDPSDDVVYISDTSRHVLRKFSANGSNLGEAGSGLRFPNQLLVHDGRLLVADTNHHRIRIVETDTEIFGQEISSIDVVPTAARKNQQTWPSHFARIGNTWWVNNMRSSMSDGGIYIFDRDWVFKRKLDLPDGADPIAIMAFSGGVLISDWNNDRVYQLTATGQLTGDFQSPGLQDLVAESVTLRWQYQTYAWLAVVAFCLIFAALIVRGLAAAGADEQGQPPLHQERVIRRPDEMLWIKPDTKAVRKIRRAIRLSGLCVLGLVLLLAYLVFGINNPLIYLTFVPPIIGLALVVLLLSRVSRASIDTAIGLCGNKITLRVHDNQEKTFTMQDIIYDRATIASPDMAVFLGRPQMPLYDRKALETEILPALAAAKAVSAWEMQKALLRMRHPQGVLNLMIFFGVLVAAAVILARDYL